LNCRTRAPSIAESRRTTSPYGRPPFRSARRQTVWVKAACVHGARPEPAFPPWHGYPGTAYGRAVAGGAFRGRHAGQAGLGTARFGCRMLIG